MKRLAIHGGQPTRANLLPLTAHWIDEADIAHVAATLRSNWLTQGPRVDEFERVFAKQVDAAEAVAFSSGTAALHAMMHVLDLKPEDEVIVPALASVAGANAVLHCGARPVLADVSPTTLLVDTRSVKKLINPRTRAVLAVDFAGQPCDYNELRALCERHQVALLADACHALGGAQGGKPVGNLADMSAFSLSPVRGVTSGEGGVVTTNDAQRAQRMRDFRNHGFAAHPQQSEGPLIDDMMELGYNYRMSELASALGLSQLRKLDLWVARRGDIAVRYGEAFSQLRGMRAVGAASDVRHAYQLYLVDFDVRALHTARASLYDEFRAEGIDVQMNFRPINLHSYYQRHLHTRTGMCPIAERMAERVMALPIFPRMTDRDVDDVITAATKIVEYHVRR